NPFFVSVAFFCLMGAAGLGIYMAFFGSSRAIEERFADLAVKMRIAHGALEGDETEETFGRMLFKWAAKRLPPPDPNTPKGEKLSQTLAQAGFIKSGSAQIFQAARLFSAA